MSSFNWGRSGKQRQAQHQGTQFRRDSWRKHPLREILADETRNLNKRYRQERLAGKTTLPYAEWMKQQTEAAG